MKRSRTRQVQAVVFDLDDTLFDHTGAANDALHRWLPTVGVEPSATSIALWFASEERHLEAWRAGRISWAEQRRSRLRDVLPDASSLTEAELDARFADYLARYEAAWRAFPDVDGTLAELRDGGVRIGILTNGAAAQQRAKVIEIGFDDRFEFLLTSEDLGVAKPHRDSYLAACRRFELDPAAVVHVGDRPDLDVTAPREAGLRALLIDRDDRHREAGSLRSLRELPRRIAAGSA